MDQPGATPLSPLWKISRVRHLLLIALCAEIGYAVLNISTMPIFLADTLRLGESSVGLVIAAFLISEAAFKSPMGHLSERYGRRLFMTVGPGITILTSLLSFAIPFAVGDIRFGRQHTFIPESHKAWLVIGFVFLRILDGLGAAMLWPAAFAAMGEAVEDGQRQQAMSLLNVCYLLGIALAFPISGAVNQLSGQHWSSLFLAFGLFCAVFICAWRFMPADGYRARKAAGEEEQEVPLSAIFASAKEIPTYLVLAVITFAGIGFPMAIIKNFGLDQFGMNEFTFGLLVLPAAGLMAALSVPMSKIGDRIGLARAVHLGMGLCAAGVSFIALGAFLPPLRTAFALALGGLPVGVGFLLAIPAWMASVSDANPKKRASNLGAVMAAQGVGAIIGAPLGAICYDKLQFRGKYLLDPHLQHWWITFGHYSPFLGCAICVTAGWLVGLRTLQDKKP